MANRASHFDKWEYLSLLLEKAAQELDNREDEINIYCSYNSFHEFAEDLRSFSGKILQGDQQAIYDVEAIFLPTGDWDDAGGTPDLAEQICKSCSAIKKS